MIYQQRNAYRREVATDGHGRSFILGYGLQDREEGARMVFELFYLDRYGQLSWAFTSTTLEELSRKARANGLKLNEQRLRWAAQKISPYYREEYWHPKMEESARLEAQFSEWVKSQH